MNYGTEHYPLSQPRTEEGLENNDSEGEVITSKQRGNLKGRLGTKPSRLDAKVDIIPKEIQKPSTNIMVSTSGQVMEEPLKRTSVSVLKKVLGNKRPQWIRLNTDLIGNQTSIERKG